MHDRNKAKQARQAQQEAKQPKEAASVDLSSAKK